MQNQPSHCLIVGYGYVAQHLAPLLLARGLSVSGTYRPEGGDQKTAAMRAEQVEPVAFEAAAMQAALERVTHLLISLPTGEGDALANQWLKSAHAPVLQWVGYLSSTAVYGDAGGAPVDETTPPNPHDDRGRARLLSEARWREMAGDAAYVVFRLAAIYGVGRSALDQVASGRVRPIFKPGHKVSRIHADDIAAILAAAMARPDAVGIYNLADRCPAPTHEVLAYAAELLGLPAPELQPFDAATLSAMQASIYAVSRTIAGHKALAAFGIDLAYPDYRAGLQAIAATQSAHKERVIT